MGKWANDNTVLTKTQDLYTSTNMKFQYLSGRSRTLWLMKILSNGGNLDWKILERFETNFRERFHFSRTFWGCFWGISRSWNQIPLKSIFKDFPGFPGSARTMIKSSGLRLAVGWMTSYAICSLTGRQHLVALSFMRRMFRSGRKRRMTLSTPL